MAGLEIREQMLKIAEKRRRFGYRRVGILLERKDMVMNEKKLYRIYREEGLSVRRRLGRERARGSRSPMPVSLRQTSADRWTSCPTPSGLPQVRSPLFLNQWRTMARPGAQRRLLRREPRPDR